MRIIGTVNLVGTRPEGETDALVGRVSCIKAVASDRDLRHLLGYVASPGSLKAEACYSNWIEFAADPDVRHPP